MKEEILILLEIYFLGNKPSEGHDFDLWMKGVSFFVRILHSCRIPNTGGFKISAFHLVLTSMCRI